MLKLNRDFKPGRSRRGRRPNSMLMMRCGLRGSDNVMAVHFRASMRAEVRTVTSPSSGVGKGPNRASLKNFRPSAMAYSGYRTSSHFAPTHQRYLTLPRRTHDDPPDVLKMLKEKEVKFVDLALHRHRGKEQHVSVPTKQFTMDKFAPPRLRRLVDRRLEGIRRPTCC